LAKKPIDLPTLQRFFTALTNDMLDRLNPDKGTGEKIVV